MKASKLIPSGLSTYLKEAVSKIRVREGSPTPTSMVRKMIKNPPVSLSVNVKFQVNEKSQSTISSVPSSTDKIVSQPMVENTVTTTKPTTTDLDSRSYFEAAMSEMVNSSEPMKLGDVFSSHHHRSRIDSHTSKASSTDSGIEDTDSKDLPSSPSPSSSSITSSPLSRSAIYSRSRQLVKSLSASCSSRNTMRQVFCLQELIKHLSVYPESAGPSVSEGAIPLILRIRNQSSFKEDRVLSQTSRQALTLLGHTDSPRGRGIRILSIDGGGIRGVSILEILRHLESLTGQPVHKMFDLICGVSTGAILAMLLGTMRKDVTSCEELYRLVSKNLFVSDFWRGTSRLLLTHAYYDSSVWEKILKEVFGEKTLIESAYEEDCPKVMAISASMSSPRIKPYVFRNFNLPVGERWGSTYGGQYEGSSKHKVWQAVRASTSAPGYFEDFILDNHVHSDGGILINNPSAIAIHEAQLLWPNERIQCVVSLGTGKYTPPQTLESMLSSYGEGHDTGTNGSPSKVATSLKAKISSLIDSATDTEITHRLLQDLMPEGTYFRMNPTLTEWVGLDESREEKLDQLRTDALMYIRKNDYKMSRASEAIMKDRTIGQKTADYLKLKYQMMFQ